MLPSHSTFQLSNEMLFEFAMTNAGCKRLSTKNFPEPVNSTDVPLSMKMTRSIAAPECRRTGQSTSNVKAPFLAAAKALIAPEVSSDVPVQDTQAPIDFFTGTDAAPACILATAADRSNTIGAIAGNRRKRLHFGLGRRVTLIVVTGPPRGR